MTPAASTTTLLPLAAQGLGPLAALGAAPAEAAHLTGGFAGLASLTLGNWLLLLAAACLTDRNIEGVVEEIGWRMTQIRTFEMRPLYVPNSIFNSIAVENPSRMTFYVLYFYCFQDRTPSGQKVGVFQIMQTQ